MSKHIIKINGKTPQWGEGCFIASTSAICGDVVLGDNCSVWYSAVLRADDNIIRIGDGTNVQDGAVIHVSEGEGGETLIGSGVVIGHNATVHAARIADRCLVGMGSTILDGTVMEEGAVVAAHALVLGKTHIGPRELWGGVPAKLIKVLTPEAVAKMVDEGARSYIEWAEVYNKATEEKEG